MCHKLTIFLAIFVKSAINWDFTADVPVSKQSFLYFALFSFHIFSSQNWISKLNLKLSSCHLITLVKKCFKIPWRLVFMLSLLMLLSGWLIDLKAEKSWEKTTQNSMVCEDKKPTKEIIWALTKVINVCYISFLDKRNVHLMTALFVPFSDWSCRYNFIFNCFSCKRILVFPAKDPAYGVKIHLPLINRKKSQLQMAEKWNSES